MQLSMWLLLKHCGTCRLVTSVHGRFHNNLCHHKITSLCSFPVGSLGQLHLALHLWGECIPPGINVANWCLDCRNLALRVHSAACSARLWPQEHFSRAPTSLVVPGLHRRCLGWLQCMVPVTRLLLCRRRAVASGRLPTAVH